MFLQMNMIVRDEGRSLRCINLDITSERTYAHLVVSTEYSWLRAIRTPGSMDPYDLVYCTHLMLLLLELELSIEYQYFREYELLIENNIAFTSKALCMIL